MSEGTKLGEFEDKETLEDKKSDYTSSGETLTGTKIGELSSFEKDLFGDDAQEKKQAPIKQSATKEPEAQPSLTEVELLLTQEMEKTVFDFQEGDLVNGTVRTVEKGGVIVDFGYKSDGYLANNELGVTDDNKIEKLSEGDDVRFMIEKLETKEGYTLLSRKKAQVEEAWEFLVNCQTSK